MGTRGFYGFRYNKRYYLVYNAYDSYYSCLGMKLLREIRQMIKNNEYEKWLEQFTRLSVIHEYNDIQKPIVSGSYLDILNSGYICIEQIEDNKINYNHLDGVFFYILDFDKKKFRVKEIGYRTQKYNLFNGEIDRVYFEDSSNDDSSSDD